MDDVLDAVELDEEDSALVLVGTPESSILAGHWVRAHWKGSLIIDGVGKSVEVPASSPVVAT
ncbi:MAG: hypothetical protein Q9181_008017 [Wetmoreana brouardii]